MISSLTEDLPLYRAADIARLSALDRHASSPDDARVRRLLGWISEPDTDSGRYPLGALVTAALVARMIDAGATLAQIKDAHRSLADSDDVRFPFAARSEFLAGPPGVFIWSDASPRQLTHLSELNRQEASADALSTLVNRVELGTAGELVGWEPDGFSELRLKPSVQGGAATVTGTRIRTVDVAEHLEAGVTRAELSEWYGLSKRQIDQAAEFESTLHRLRTAA
jgi:uncharacterized protein (DUF433 family)